MIEHTVPPPLDLAKALNLVGGDKTLLQELADVFLEQLPTQLEALEAALGHADAEGTRHAAHSLKGALANIGATGSRDLAYELETLGHAGNLGAAPGVLRGLKHEIERMVDFLAVPGWTDGVVKQRSAPSSSSR